MSMRSFVTVASLVLLSLPGCSNRRIPGTDIEDTDDTREILQVMEKFRAGVEGRDAGAIAELVATDFHDDGGSLDTEDDYNAGNLRPKLQQQFDRVKNIRLSIDVKKIEMDDKEPIARVTYYWTLRYEIPNLASRPQTDSELKLTTLRHVDDAWKIVSGI